GDCTASVIRKKPPFCNELQPATDYPFEGSRVSCGRIPKKLKNNQTLNLMKLTIKNGSILGIASVLLLLVFGTGAPTHIKAAIQTARDHLFGALSTEHLVKVGREQLATQRKKLIDAEVNL